MSDETSIELNYAFSVAPAEGNAALYNLLRLKSNIDPTMPEEGNATTASVRENFAYSKYEIESLQAAVQTLGGELNSQTADYVSTKGDKMTGALTLEASITDPKHAVTVEWVMANAGSGGGGGIPEAPEDGKVYGRKDKGWEEITSSSTTPNVEWANILNTPEPVKDLAAENITTTSMVSGGSY